MIKSVGAGVTDVTLARFFVNPSWPSAPLFIEASLFGFATYGLSIMCFILALRSLGAARTSIYFSTAPLIGALVSVVFLHDPFTKTLAAAALLMALGIYLHLTENTAASRRR